MFYSASENSFYPPELKAAYVKAGTWPSDLIEVTSDEWSVYGQGTAPEGMQRGSGTDGRPSWVPIPPILIKDLATRKRDALEAGRKMAEKVGVTLGGIRYAGDPSNRQALMEALDLADTTGQTTFASWKDSDDRFHTDHLVADVRQALNDIAARRGQLIAREGELNAQIDAALEAEDRDALEAIEWSEG